MEKEIWFKRKRYGWGWYPATWQGWAVLCIWIVLFVCGEVIFMRHLEEGASWHTVAAFLVYTSVLVSGLIGISYRYGEKPRWQWGDATKDGR